MNQTNYASRLARFDLNLFRVFATVYLEGNLTRAANRLSLSQSAISHALARMREQIGDPLFVREAQGVVPTVLAQRLWPSIRDGLERLGQAIVLSEDFDPVRDMRRVRIAINDKAESSLLPNFTSALHALVPGLVIESVRLDRASLNADLAAGRLDVAIDAYQGDIDGLSSALLLHDKWIVIARSSEAITRKKYLAASHAIVSSRRTGRAVEDIELARLGISRTIVARCQSYDAAARLVAQSDMLLTMPRVLAGSLNTYQGNHIHPFPLKQAGLRLHLFWHLEREHDPANTWLRSVLLGAMSTR